MMTPEFEFDGEEVEIVSAKQGVQTLELSAAEATKLIPASAEDDGVIDVESIEETPFDCPEADNADSSPNERALSMDQNDIDTRNATKLFESGCETYRIDVDNKKIELFIHDIGFTLHQSFDTKKACKDAIKKLKERHDYVVTIKSMCGGFDGVPLDIFTFYRRYPVFGDNLHTIRELSLGLKSWGKPQYFESDEEFEHAWLKIQQDKFSIED